MNPWTAFWLSVTVFWICFFAASTLSSIYGIK